MRSELIKQILADTPPEVEARIMAEMIWLASAEPCADHDPGAAVYYGEVERMATAIKWPTYEEAVRYLKSSGWPCMRYTDPDGYIITYELIHKNHD